MDETGTGLRALRTLLARRVEISGRCICGVLTQEAHWQGARFLDGPIELGPVGERRGIAWHPVEQVFLVTPKARKHIDSQANCTEMEDRKE